MTSVYYPRAILVKFYWSDLHRRIFLMSYRHHADLLYTVAGCELKRGFEISRYCRRSCSIYLVKLSPLVALPVVS